MFSYSMVQMVRRNANKIDKDLRDEIMNLYRPFKWTPCFLHKPVEAALKHLKKKRLIIEFYDDCHDDGCLEVMAVIERRQRQHFRSEFPKSACCSVDITTAGLEELLADCTHIKRIYMNQQVHSLLDVAVEAIHARDIGGNETSLSGEGVSIAVIDTGIHPHADIAGRIQTFKDFVNDRTAPYDDNGHGTHCAGDAAGDGTASSMTYRGPAYAANLIGVKVLDKMGSGSLETIMQGVEWCMQYNEDNPEHRIDIISMSLGSTAQSYNRENDDPMVKVVEKAWESGIIMCVAAGNSGPDPQTIASPGVSDQVITVGALDDNDTGETREDDDVAGFSSRGPTVYDVTKPDILAPGVNIISLRSPNSYLDKLQKSSRVNTDYFVLSGTSMATPICAGVVALIKEHAPDKSPEEIKNALKNSTDLWTDRALNDYGAGYLNAANAIEEIDAL